MGLFLNETTIMTIVVNFWGGFKSGLLDVRIKSYISYIETIRTIVDGISGDLEIGMYLKPKVETNSN